MAKILIVDDDADVLELLKFHLDRTGHEAFTARGGADALERAAYDRPDLVLLDLRRPIVDGVRVLQILRDNPLTRRVGVVIMSAGPLNELRPRLAADELVRCLEKPLDFGQLSVVIAELIAAGSTSRA
ncbi:MAG: response regulator [Elusimicrobiota bacterium]|nr:response regulator [Elusimicrobiota bacterium]